MFNDYPDVLTVKQLAKILNIGINNTYKLLQNGTIRSHRIGKKYLIPKICVIDYLKSARYNEDTRWVSDCRRKE